MATPMFAMLIGLWELVLIFAALAVMAALVGGVVILVVWLARKGKTNTPPFAQQASFPNCPRCGSLLPPDAPQGLCPRCVMAVALETQTETAGAEGPHGTKAAKPPPPAPAEIAKLFPQLEIIECLGRGGMGAVYKARQPKLDRFVALKILAPERQADTKFRERFEREARTLARLNHPNIVMVYDFGEADGYCYLLMEYVDGLTLRQVMQGRKFADGEALSIVPKICEALEFAHGRGVVHRDIKPENILLNRVGQVKIADFGIAKILEPGAQDFSLTGAKDVVGTPHYMAPEQVERPMQVDHRADIFSLGVVFYEMLTGELPLGKFQPPSRKVQVDVRLDEVVLHALEKEPDRRYQHAGEVRTDVETIVASASSPKQPTAPRFSGARPTSHSGALFTVMAVIALVLAVIFSLGWLFRTPGDSPATEKQNLPENAQLPAAAVPTRGVQAPPVVIETFPESGKDDIDPAVTELSVTFSKPMRDGSWTWANSPEEGFPETTGQPHFEPDKRTCVLPVKLKPGSFYAIWINNEYHQEFKDTNDRPAVPYLLIFQTKQK